MSSQMVLRSTNSFALSQPKFNGCFFPLLYHINVSSLTRHVPATALSFCQLQASKLHDSPVTVASDVRYGGKQIISVDSPLYDYILSNVREPKVNALVANPFSFEKRSKHWERKDKKKEKKEVLYLDFISLFFFFGCIQILRELREETATMRGSQMQVSPDQAQLLAMLVQILGAKRCIEVGTYTGYSSLAVALVLPEGGQLVACERDGKSIEVAKRYYDQAGVSHKVDVRHGLAADTLKSLIQNGESCRYDFAFVDAEKRMYQEYFELLLQLVRVGGLIVVDNVLWHGRVADPLVNDSKTLSIRNFNQNLMEDKRVDISMVPIGDGMTICRKR